MQRSSSADSKLATSGASRAGCRGWSPPLVQMYGFGDAHGANCVLLVAAKLGGTEGAITLAEGRRECDRKLPVNLVQEVEFRFAPHDHFKLARSGASAIPCDSEPLDPLARFRRLIVNCWASPTKGCCGQVMWVSCGADSDRPTITRILS